MGCESLGEIEVPEGVTEISDRAFESCYSLERVILPSTLTSIGKRIFADCYSVDIKKGGKDYSKVIRLLNLRDDVIDSLNNLKNAIRYFPQRIKLERALKKIDYD